MGDSVDLSVGEKVSGPRTLPCITLTPGVDLAPEVAIGLGAFMLGGSKAREIEGPLLTDADLIMSYFISIRHQSEQFSPSQEKRGR